MTAHDRTRTAVAATWLRNAQIAVYAFMSVSALSGLGYVFYSAFIGDALGAIGGAFIAIGGVALGCLALAAVRFGDVMLSRTQQIELLLSRLEALETAFEAQGVAVDLSRVGAHDPEPLVAANLADDVFPRIAKPAAAEPSDELADAAIPDASPETILPSDVELQWQSAYQNGDLLACRRALEQLRGSLAPERAARMEQSLRDLSQAKSVQLREDFAALVRLRNYEAALLTGEEIARIFPDTAMAREFQDIRPHLQRRAEEQHASAV